MSPNTLAWLTWCAIWSNMVRSVDPPARAACAGRGAIRLSIVERGIAQCPLLPYLSSTCRPRPPPLAVGRTRRRLRPGPLRAPARTPPLSLGRDMRPLRAAWILHSGNAGGTGVVRGTPRENFSASAGRK